MSKLVKNEILKIGFQGYNLEVVVTETEFEKYTEENIRVYMVHPKSGELRQLGGYSNDRDRY